MSVVKKIISVLRIALIAILSIIALFFVIFICKRVINKNKPTSVFNIGFYQVRSWSMYDYLSVGDLVVVVKIDDDKYCEGMVVTYLTDEMKIPVTHKIVKREGDIITTRGINSETNNSDDTPFDVKYIIGEVKCVWKGFEKFVNFIKSPLGIVTIFLGVICIFGIGYYIDIKVMKKEEVFKNEN